MFLTFHDHCCKFTPSQPSADAHECCLAGKGVLKRIFEGDFLNPKPKFFACQNPNVELFHEYVESGVDDVFIIRVAYNLVIKCIWNANISRYLYLYVIWDFRADEPRFMIEDNSQCKESVDMVELVFSLTLNNILNEYGCNLTFERQHGILDLPECVRPVLGRLWNSDRSIEGFHHVNSIDELYSYRAPFNNHINHPGNYYARAINIAGDVNIITNDNTKQRTIISDEEIAQVLLSCVGKGKVIDNKQKWSGAYWLLRWACNYPVDINDFCKKIDSLKLGLPNNLKCNYDNIRRICSCSFMLYDPRKMEDVKVSKTDMPVFLWCREIVLKLIEEFEKAHLLNM